MGILLGICGLNVKPQMAATSTYSLRVSLNYSEIKIITPGDAFAKFDLIYGMAETPIQMISEITVKNDTSGATAKIYASSGLRVLQKKAEWKYTLYQEMLSKCALFNNFATWSAESGAAAAMSALGFPGAPGGALGAPCGKIFCI
ncbi:hypothetical protein MAR_020150 [Mya arenaria]|uniref:Uncharacterized protein n=1 Tax=Mya arenaria TaxID=6604 RepID=A0ABY7ECA7_MYAAR|nr:hypothetical protein MAR_020150 [Mya arenaria]